MNRKPFLAVILSLVFYAAITGCTPDGDNIILPDFYSIHGTVWGDNNGNGIQENGEPGLEGVTVRLYATDGKLLQETKTGTSGGYRIPNISKGAFKLEFIATPGYEFTLQDQGSDDTVDSDVRPTGSGSGWIDEFKVPDDLVWDAGLVKSEQPIFGSVLDDLESKTITGFVWDDINDNGIQNDLEPGLVEVIVKLYSVDGDTRHLEQETRTDESGAYEFPDIQVGVYVIEFIPPNGFEFTLQDQGSDDAIDSDARSSEIVGMTDSFTVPETTELDAGLMWQGIISGEVWFDVNSNGIQDDEEFSQTGVMVNLYRAGELIRQTQTDGAGYYVFTNIERGSHKLEFIPPSGKNFTLPDQGSDDMIDSDVHPDNAGNGWTEKFNTPSRTEWDAGLVDLRGSFYKDPENDGIGCASGQASGGVLPQIDIIKVQAEAMDQAGSCFYDFSIELAQPVSGSEGFWGGIEFFDPAAPMLSLPDSGWFFNNTGNMSFNFHWSGSNIDVMAAQVTDGAWGSTTFPGYTGTVDGSQIILMMPCEVIPENVAWFATTTTDNFDVCDQAGLGENGLPSLPLPVPPSTSRIDQDVSSYEDPENDCQKYDFSIGSCDPPGVDLAALNIQSTGGDLTLDFEFYAPEPVTSLNLLIELDLDRSAETGLTSQNMGVDAVLEGYSEDGWIGGSLIDSAGATIGELPFETTLEVLETGLVLTLSGDDSLADFAFRVQICSQNYWFCDYLPDENALIYPAESPLDEPPSETSAEPDAYLHVTTFVESFVAAMQNEDTVFLFQNLHPVVLEIYGADACQRYLEKAVNPTLNIDILNISGPGSWNFMRDDITTPIPNAYTVEANVSAQDQQTTQEIHYAPDDSGALRWFTDCGDPLP